MELLSRAAAMGRGCIEPFYKLHSTRLKMLLQRRAPPGLLLQHCFQAAAGGGGGGALVAAIAEPEASALVFDDACAAMRACLDSARYYHKARPLFTRPLIQKAKP